MPRRPCLIIAIGPCLFWEIALMQLADQLLNCCSVFLHIGVDACVCVYSPLAQLSCTICPPVCVRNDAHKNYVSPVEPLYFHLNKLYFRQVCVQIVVLNRKCKCFFMYFYRLLAFLVFQINICCVQGNKEPLSRIMCFGWIHSQIVLQPEP